MNLTLIENIFFKYLHKSPTSITIVVAALLHIVTALVPGFIITGATLAAIDKIAFILVAVFIPDGSGGTVGSRIGDQLTAILNTLTNKTPALPAPTPSGDSPKG